MSSISTNYSQAINKGLSYLLNTSSSSKSTTSATSLLDSSSSDSSSNLLTLLKQNLGMRDYNLPKDSSGKSVVVTIDEMNAATSSSTKLSLASDVSETVLMQADAASRTGIASRVSDITDQAQSVLTAVSSSISSLTGDSTDTTSTQTTLKGYRDTISTTLNNIYSALTEVKGLLSKATAADRVSVSETLETLDSTAASIATKAGVSWTSLSGNSDNTVSGYTASSSSTDSSSSSSTSLVDFLA